MPEKPPAALAADEPSNHRSKGRILVIDDEIDIRESLEALLTLGLRVHPPSPADEARSGVPIPVAG